MKKINGIIYKYESPNNKVYIGQTVNEERRRKEFFNIKKSYSGLKINNARLKYKPENFKYEILYSKEYDNIKESIEDLNEKEEFFIKKYNSVKNGYNTSIGGESIRAVMQDEDCKQRMINSLQEYYKTHENPFKGKKHSKETKEVLKQKCLGRRSSFAGKKCTEKAKEKQALLLQEYYKTHENPFKGKKHSKETLECIQNTRKYNVAKINPQNDEIIEIYKSLLSAAKSCGIKTPDIIKKVCDKYISPTGLKYEIAYSFKWKFVLKDKGSTTTERASNVLTNDETK